MDDFQDISKNSLSLVLIFEKDYDDKVIELVKSLEEDKKICYVCLSKPYKYILEQLESTLAQKFIFIDVLSSHYGKPGLVENCIFIEGPEKLKQLQDAIFEAIENKGCRAVIFDTISSLLVYEHSHDIVRFTHELNVARGHEDVIKIFLILKDQFLMESPENLIKDISMFADKTFDLE